jgi:hypothetical protein
MSSNKAGNSSCKNIVLIAIHPCWQHVRAYEMVTNNSGPNACGQMLLMPHSPNIMGILRCPRVLPVHIEDTVASETCFIREQN